ncbi:MAG: hypothetical protein D3920_00785 [Candidatus Electrothrix sp. AW2]|nr:hypothetical protein [Candidatus Electrothrix gigas]
MPLLNDKGGRQIPGTGGNWTTMVYDYAYLRWGDENYGTIINSTPRQIHQSPGCYFPTRIYKELPKKPLQGLKSAVFDGTGAAILRGKDGGGDTFLLMDYGAHGGGHGHYDKLNLLIFADNDELTGEPYVYPHYESPIYEDWNKTTIAHNTVTVDQRNQMATAGKLLVFADDRPRKKPVNSSLQIK